MRTQRQHPPRAPYARRCWLRTQRHKLPQAPYARRCWSRRHSAPPRSSRPTFCDGFDVLAITMISICWCYLIRPTPKWLPQHGESRVLLALCRVPRALHCSVPTLPPLRGSKLAGGPGLARPPPRRQGIHRPPGLRRPRAAAPRGVPWHRVKRGQLLIHLHRGVPGASCASPYQPTRKPKGLQHPNPFTLPHAAARATPFLSVIVHSGRCSVAARLGHHLIGAQREFSRRRQRRQQRRRGLNLQAPLAGFSGSAGRHDPTVQVVTSRHSCCGRRNGLKEQ